MRRSTWLSTLLLSAVIMGRLVHGGEIGFLEDFSLAQDRAAVLKQLIPGSDDYYYFHCLHYQNTEQYDKVDALLPTWIQRHGHTPRVREIRHRQALLTYDKNPGKSLAYLVETLGLQFNHERQLPGAQANLPSKLNPELYAREALLNREYSQHGHLEGVEESALDWLIGQDLTPDRRRNLLSRLSRPDHANLVKLIVADLNYANSGGFGSLGIHRQLLVSQLEELVKAKPELLNETNFVYAYIAKLQPSPDEDWQHDPKSLDAYLSRLQAFVDRLAPAHNSLKAHVLYHRLVLDRSQGKYDKEKFLAYLKLPRHTGYAAVKFLETQEARTFPADLNANYTPVTMLAPIGNDEPLVRSYLMHFFVDAAGYKEFEPYVNDVYLKHLFAETKILNGLGEAEQWYSLLPPEQYQALKERVDIEFAFTNKTSFAADAPVALDVDVKNVGTLLVKVFEINTRNFYRRKQKEIDTSVNLDGLVANEEFTFKYEESPLRRVRRHFEFPTLKKQGVYVIDFIGNGKSSRAVVRKGRLNFLVQNTAAGHLFTILNEKNEALPTASLWLAGHEYKADKEGRLVVPFSTQPGVQKIVICNGEFCSLAEFNHEAESYSLQAGLYVDREQLLSRRKAQLLIRPMLRLGQRPAPIKLLEEVRLVITSTDLEGVSASKEVSDLKLFEDRETKYEFLVPPRTASISFLLKAKVQNLSLNQKQDLAVQETYTLNEIDRTDKIEDLHLSQFNGQYTLFVLGKTGEPKKNRPVNLALKQRDFREPVYVSLQSNEQGRIELGELADVASLTATGPEGTSRTWNLPLDHNTFAQSLHGNTKQVLELPYLGSAEKASRSEFSLLEIRGGTFRGDHFDAIKLEGGLVKVGPLPAGDYDLLYKPENVHVQIRIAAGELKHGFVHSDQRRLEVKDTKPLAVASVETGENDLTLHIANSSKYTRVHVIATRFLPTYRAFDLLGRIRGTNPRLYGVPHAESVYLSGRNIGDELRYILDRRHAPKYPGNMLERPSLLLNPWAIRSTETSVQQALDGELYSAAGGGNAPAPSEAAPMSAPPTAPEQGMSADLDFLAHTSVVVANLAPDKDGLIKIPRDALDHRQHLQVVAVDPEQTLVHWLSLPEQPIDLLDLRLAKGLDPKSHFIQQKQVSFVPADKELVLPDVSGSRFEVYDSLARVYGLYVTLSKDPKLIEFSFITNWNKLKPEEKRERYSKYACHELSFFLMRKDPEFFKTVIVPYLANKKDKTFLDEYLLDADLKAYRDPWRNERLNVVERILLGRALKAEQPFVTQQVRDQFALLPPDLDRRTLLFQTAILGSALDSEKLVELEALDDATVTAEAGIPADAPALQAGEGMAFGIANGYAPAGMSGKPRTAHSVERMKRMEEAAKQMTKMQKKSGADRDYAEKADELKEAEYFDADGIALGMRSAARQLFRQIDKTLEWAENNYYKLPIEQQNAELVTVNSFWRDFAMQAAGEPFYSQNMADASRNFTEMMFALSLLDLPFEAGKHEMEFEGPKLKFAAKTPTVVFHEEIKPAGEQDKDSPILVSQNFFQASDRYRIVENEQVDKYVQEEFLINVVYGCQVVVTNPSSSRQKLDVLLQIPVGSLPVSNTLPTRSVAIDLQPFATHRLEYYFYFPAPAKYQHYPVHVSKNGRLTAFAPALVLNVVAEPSKTDTESWEFVSQQGTDEQVLKYLRDQNLYRVDLGRIAFRMQDAKFFKAAIDILSQRHAYNHVLWSYAVKHNAPTAIAEFLLHADNFVNEAGLYLKSPLLVIDPVARRTYQHLEYKPLVNARAHRLGQRRQIVNDRFYSQYLQTLALLSYHRTLSDNDLMAVTYYLLLQDRVEEALATFAQVNADALSTRLQYDYAAAYLDMFSEEPKQAPAIVARYANYPVDRWRNGFAAIAAQLEEISGAKGRVVDPEDRGQQITSLASTDPTFEVRVEGQNVILDHQNLEKVTVNYYVMDIELLFSRNPFVQQFGEDFGLVRPNLSQALQLKEGDRTTRFAIPKALQTSNVLVEVVGGGESKLQAAFANVLTVQTIENYAQVKVAQRDDGRPLPKTYVKVYAQMHDGSVKFYKDGYTDLRGRFDYGSVSTNELDNVKKFSLLVMSENQGALIREVQPPKR
jgi:hypothetical protein